MDDLACVGECCRLATRLSEVERRAREGLFPAVADSGRYATISAGPISSVSVAPAVILRARLMPYVRILDREWLCEGDLMRVRVSVSLGGIREICAKFCPVTSHPHQHPHTTTLTDTRQRYDTIQHTLR